MTTYRLIAATTVAAFSALFFLVPGRDALSSDSSSSTTGPPGLVVSGKEPGWFELRGTPVSVDDQSVKDWTEVNAVLRDSSYRVLHELGHQVRGQQRDKIPATLDGGTFTIAIRGAAMDGAPVEERFTVQRWFPKRSLFSRSGPTKYLRFEILIDDPHLN